MHMHTAELERVSQVQVAAVTRAAETQLRDTVTGAGVAILDSAPSDLWQRLHHLHAQASTSAATSAFCQLKVRQLLCPSHGRVASCRCPSMCGEMGGGVG